MAKYLLLLLAQSLATTTILSADTLAVSVAGQFSNSDSAGPLVAPDGIFALQFDVDSNPTPLGGSVTTLGFDLPINGFLYSLNGNSINTQPNEIRFNTLANGGLFDVIFGSGLNTTEFDFQGNQLFGGSTSAPAFAPGSFSLSSWTYSDPAGNYDFETPAGAAISASTVPEPSVFVPLVAGFAALFLKKARRRLLSAGAILFVVALHISAQAPITQSINVPNTGQIITPLAPRGARFTYLNPGLPNYPGHVVGQAVTSVSSPDHKTLLVLTSGDYGIYTSSGSRDTAASTDWVFVYDITNPIPVQKQAIQVKNSYNGIVFDPSGTTFYVAGGRDDNMHIFTLTGGIWSEAMGSPIALGHTSQAGGVSPEAAGIAITQDGTKIVITNYENDSITVLTKSSGVWSKTADFDLRPGKINSMQAG
ncbi:MAG: hypothetical protein JO099_06555, partial [Acidobacteriia bacterium]|nr:hypothetical protein [Terriglobia bacterium]